MSNFLQKLIPESEKSMMTTLQSLPPEILSSILSVISFSDLGNLFLTGSLDLRMKINKWIKSICFQRKVIALLSVPIISLNTAEALDSWLKVTSDFGLLIKKITVTSGHRPDFRLRLLSHYYERLDTLLRTSDHLLLWSQYLSEIGLASALVAFTKGWDVSDYNKILDWLRTCVNNLDGINQRMLRTYFWKYLDSDSEKATRTSWLITKISLPDVPKDYQAAKFLMCLFGPAKLNLTDELRLQLNVLQLEALNMDVGKPDLTALCRQGEVSYMSSNIKYYFF